jgi:hypothetical protein
MPFLRPEEWFKSKFTWAWSKARENKKNRSWPDERKSYLALFGPDNAPRMEGAV